MPCFQGVIPSTIATCSPDGVPNITFLSIVHYVDSERIALSRQFFNKTRANLDANPQAKVVVMHPETAEQFALDVRFLHTETEGPTFESMRANLDAVASQTGMTGVFRLRGVDIYRVEHCAALGEPADSPVERRRTDAVGALDEFVRRLSGCVEYDEATRVALEALEDLFGFGQSILLAPDERGGRLFAVASNGYAGPVAGAEVPIGVGVIGIAAERRRVVSVPSLARSRAMRAAAEDEGPLRRDAPAPAPDEIPLPGLDDADSVAAIPLIVRGALTGVLYLESERPGTFGPAAESMLRILGGHLATTLAALGSQDVAIAPAPAPGGAEIAVTYYQADDSVFVDGDYLVKGAPGRILWKLLRESTAEGRTAFTNRELRLDEGLGLPAGNDNLEARLLVLRKRLTERDCGIRLTRVGRGRLELELERPAALSEVETSGPMRVAHPPRETG